MLVNTNLFIVDTLDCWPPASENTSVPLEDYSTAKTGQPRDASTRKLVV